LEHRPILDPRNVTPTGTTTLTWPTPKAIRDLGYIPDLKAIQAGDLLLISHISPNWFSRCIAKFQQKGGYAPEAARWTHAAVYAGDGYVCEATGRGVVTVQLFKYLMGKNLLLFRRSPDLVLEDGQRLVIKAQSRLNKPYPFHFLPFIAHQALHGFWRTNSSTRLRAPICSVLFADAYSYITGKTIENRESGEITPAFLSQTSQLVDVHVEWLRIEPVPDAWNGFPRSEDDAARGEVS
jgi:Orthopoxvirus protein of unknown function (DUF830).